MLIRKYLLLICSLLCLHPFVLMGQSVFDYNFPDTVKPFNPKVFKVKNIDSLKPTQIDTITNPEGLIFWSTQGDHLDGPYIAIKKKDFYNVFFMTGDNGCSGWTSFDRIDFDGKGNKELLIKYKWNTGNPHFCEYHEGFYLWNMDALEELMQVEYYYSYWLYPEMERDSTGSYYQVDTADHGQQECYHYEPTISRQMIIFTESSPYCQWEEKEKDKNAVISNPEVITYEFKHGYLLKSKHKH
jgi:hypothetical protein